MDAPGIEFKYSRRNQINEYHFHFMDLDSETKKEGGTHIWYVTVQAAMVYTFKPTRYTKTLIKKEFSFPTTDISIKGLSKGLKANRLDNCPKESKDRKYEWQLSLKSKKLISKSIVVCKQQKHSTL